MKLLSNRDKLKAFIASNVTDLITLLDKNVKLDIYVGLNIHGLYCYLEIIGDTTNLTYSGWRSQLFVKSSSVKNDIEFLHPVISDLRIR